MLLIMRTTVSAMRLLSWVVCAVSVQQPLLRSAIELLTSTACSRTGLAKVKGANLCAASADTASAPTWKKKPGGAMQAATDSARGDSVVSPEGQGVQECWLLPLL